MMLEYLIQLLTATVHDADTKLHIAVRPTQIVSFC